MKRKHCILSTAFLLFFLIPGFSQRPVEINSNTFGEIKARHIGPATMSGRISAIDAVHDDPRIIWVGSAGGGVWKSENGGVKFKPVFDEYTQSIGAIAIVQDHPDTVYVGTGESKVRNSVSVGTGIYKTTDGGESWKEIGLDSTERISRIVIHPDNPDIVYVAAMGHLWNPNEERGVYRTRDGGQSWEKVLYVDENTGASDITINPENPDILYAGMWEFRRKPYYFTSGGPGSGLYKSEDGGDTWFELENGLPDAEKGRIAVAVSPVLTDMVYAVIEAADKQGGLYRSDDDGDSWERVNKTEAVLERPFYFHQIYPDPVDTMRVYKPGFNLNVSENGGKNLTIAYVGGGNVHVDHHAFWISKEDNNLLYLGTDGGVYKSIDQGKTWIMFRNLPVSQFYRVSVDMENPYNVYGGLQDNGSWMAPNKSPGGVENSDWKNFGFGDGFYAFADPEDPNILYWQSQGGNFVRFYQNTGEIKEIKPYGDEELGDLRWNWNSAIHLSPTTDAMYVGAQYLFKSNNRGDSWERISDDLTTNDPKRQQQETTGGITIDNSTAENNATIYAIAESPLNPDIIWVGSDDGLLHYTKDGGQSWVNVTPNIPDLPEGNWVSSVEPGRYEEGTVFVTFDNHRTGDMKPYVYKSDDFGKTFTSLVDENIEGYCFKILQDPVNPELLFLGTEFGLYASIDGGEVWSRFTGNIPKVAIHEMVFHPRENDLIMATHGRGILIIDDLSPLRALNTDIIQEDLAFLPSRPYLISSMGFKQTSEGDDTYIGSNPRDAVYITYYMKKRHIFGDMYMEIYDAEGNKVAELPAGKRKGINREAWTPREKPPKVPVSNLLAGGAIIGPTYLPGEYIVKIIKGEESYEGTVNIEFDPNLPHSEEERELQLKTLRRAYRMLEDLAFVDAKISGVMEDVKKVSEAEDTKASIKKKLDPYVEKLETLKKEMVATKMGGITGEEQLREKIAGIYGAVMRYYGAPTQSQIDRLEVLDVELQEKSSQAEELLGDELVKVNKLIAKAGAEEIKVITLEEFKKE
ncbi:MAG: VPS10 domain-containing protein [Bacteroidales bacterium]